MSNTDRDSMLERWADGMERLEQYYEGIYGPPATPPSLPPITTRDAMLEAIADGVERAKRNINKKSPTYHSDSVAYVKTVPAGNVHYASLEQIGGKTLVWNQIFPSLNLTNLTANSSAGTLTENADDSVTYTLTTASSYAYIRTNIADIPLMIGGHTYYCRIDIKTPGTSVSMRINNSNTAFKTWSGLTADTRTVLETVGAISTGETNPAKYIYPTWTTGATGECILYSVTLVDLTLLYGSGNEPSTVQEFTAQFPASYYPYNAGTLVSAGVTSVVSKKADTTTLDTYPIPAEVQALEGYGWSAGTAYNYIDYEAKKFIQNVASVDLSTLTWGYGPSVGWSATLNAKNPADDDTAFNGLSATLKVTDRNTQATAFSGGTDAGMVSVSGGKVYVGTGDIGIVPSGTLYYELDEPVETDISAYLADDGLIEVEAGGTLTFPNSNGDDYRINVPSSVTFVVGEP